MSRHPSFLFRVSNNNRSVAQTESKADYITRQFKVIYITHKDMEKKRKGTVIMLALDAFLVSVIFVLFDFFMNAANMLQMIQHNHTKISTGYHW